MYALDLFKRNLIFIHLPNYTQNILSCRSKPTLVTDQYIELINEWSHFRESFVQYNEVCQT